MVFLSSLFPYLPQVLSNVLGRLSRCGVLYHSSPERMSKYQLLTARDQFRIGGPPAGVMVYTSTNGVLLFSSTYIAPPYCPGYCTWVAFALMN